MPANPNPANPNSTRLKRHLPGPRLLHFIGLLALTGPWDLPAAPDTQTDKQDFEQLDLSGNGYLSGTEITPETRGYDANRDGRIPWDEFVQGRVLGRAQGAKPAAAPDQVRLVPTESAPGTADPIPKWTATLPPLAARPGHVIGRAVFSNGSPIPHFKVTALGWSGEVHLGPSGTAPNLGSLMAQNGQYAIRTTSEIDRTKPVKALVISVYASARLTHNDKEYHLEMYPTDGKKDGSGDESFRGNSGVGVVRDFVLLIAGPKRGFEKEPPPRDTSTDNARDRSSGAFYGGTLSVSLPRDALKIMEGATCTITLTPTGPLYDGSTAKTVVRTLTVRKPDLYTAYFRDIPLGDYSAALTVTKPDGATQPLRLRILGGEFQTSIPIVFQPLGSWGVSTLMVLTES